MQLSVLSLAAFAASAAAGYTETPIGYTTVTTDAYTTVLTSESAVTYGTKTYTGTPVSDFATWFGSLPGHSACKHKQ